MKLLKYFAGSLIISFGLLIVLLLIVRAVGIEMPHEFSRYMLLIWASLAVILLPLAKKIVRV